MFVELPRRRKSHWRWATPLLATLMVAAFIWIALLPDDAAWRATLLRWGTLSGSVTEWRAALRDQRLLTLLSALFIHLGPVHLIGNLLFLLIFGLPAVLAATWIAIRPTGTPFAEYLALRWTSWRNFAFGIASLALLVGCWDLLSRALGREVTPGFMGEVMAGRTPQVG